MGGGVEGDTGGGRVGEGRRGRGVEGRGVEPDSKKSPTWAGHLFKAASDVTRRTEKQAAAAAAWLGHGGIRQGGPGQGWQAGRHSISERHSSDIRGERKATHRGDKRQANDVMGDRQAYNIKG